MTKSVADFRLRANPDYELVLFDRLSDAEQQTLEALKDDPDCYGILRPRTAGNLSIKAASRDAALLFFTLQNPGPLPRYVRQSLGQQCDRTIAKMVLDGILEIEAEGAMLSGPAAHAYIFGCLNDPQSETFLAALSRRALQYAERLDITDASVLSARLYHYNRLPACARWRQLLPDQAAVEQYLGIGQAIGDRSFSTHWTRVETDKKTVPWLAWQSRATAPNLAPGAPTYKLYVSPSLQRLREAFQATVEAAALSSAHYFKVGSDVYGLLRPDKMVLYFQRFTDLQETAQVVAQKLSDCAAHGVPFTSELAGNGLLSWGIDLPIQEPTVPWLQHESWRLWIANRLASALILARTYSTRQLPPWRFAMERLRLEGVDTETWTPSGEMLQKKSASGEAHGAN